MVGRLLFAASTSALVTGLFKVSTSSWFRLGRVQVSRNLFGAELFIVISDGSLYFCGIDGDIPLTFLLHLFDSSLFLFY